MQFHFGVKKYTPKQVKLVQRFVDADREARETHAEKVRDYEELHKHPYHGEYRGVTWDMMEDGNPTSLANLAEAGIIDRGKGVNRASRGYRSGGNSYVRTYLPNAKTQEFLEAWDQFLAQEAAATAPAVKTAREPGEMTNAERTALRQILVRRKAVLTQQLDQRKRELETVVRARIMDETKGEREAAEQRVAEVKSIVRNVKKEAEERLRKLKADGYIEHVPNLRIDEPNVKVSKTNVDQRVTEEMRRLRSLKGMGQLQIEEHFLALEEELLFGRLKSQESRDFLQRIPTVDNVLPAPAEVKELTA
jgi:hypothetical protein